MRENSLLPKEYLARQSLQSLSKSFVDRVEAVDHGRVQVPPVFDLDIVEATTSFLLLS